jgi:DNA-binding GntR family transcriptional regulator
MELAYSVRVPGTAHATLSRPPSLADAVVAHIRAAIIRGVYAPGMSLTETALAQELGTSRGTVREALRELAGQGLVRRIPHRGAVVPRLTARDAEETFTLRAELESYAARLALERGAVDEVTLTLLAEHVDAIAAAVDSADVPAMVEADVRFHASLSALSGHALLLDHLTVVQNQSQWLLFYSEAYRPRPDVTVSSHRELLDVLREGDAARVARSIHDHVSGPGAQIVARMTQFDARGLQTREAIESSRGGPDR